ncbi:MAG: glycosyltransferase family A protein [Spirochaetes bacterium]|jgi:glycosyltransferase involved in cell wall biosynthesis|nr:glycosyltransferase family A protein [Spirochaetota bacterium]
MFTLITVIIPVFNRENIIERAVQSVLNQTFTDFSLFIVDDGSTDATKKICEKFTDPRIILISQENKGVSSARNLAIAQSRSHYVAFLDSDDEWLPGKLQADCNFMKDNPMCEIFQSQEIWYRYGKRVNQKKHHQKKCGKIFKESLEQCMISPSSVVVKRDLFSEFGLFDEKMQVCEDYDLWLRITPFREVGLIDTPTIIKYGGAADQLSRSVVAIDRFRIYSMLKLLKDERYRDYHYIIIQTLKQRIKIVKEGALKNGNFRLEEGLSFISAQLEKGSMPQDFSFLLQ